MSNAHGGNTRSPARQVSHPAHDQRVARSAVDLLLRLGHADVGKPSSNWTAPGQHGDGLDEVGEVPDAE